MNKIKEVFALGLLSLLFVVIFSFQAEAIGASPARVTVDYKDGVDLNVPYSVRNNAGRDIVAEITLGGGSLAEYVSVNTQSIPIKIGQRGSFELTMKIPPGINLIGPQKLFIIITEDVPSGGGLGTRTEVMPDIIVNFPYPGKYLEINRLEVKNINIGEDTTLNWGVISRGTEVTTFYGVFSIYDTQNNRVFTKEYPTRSINPGETMSVEEGLTTRSFDAGEYNATLTVHFDGKQVDTYTIFRIGTEDIELKSYTKNLTKGIINPFSVVAENLWNGKFRVYATINIQGVTATTPTMTAMAFSNVVLEQYINAQNLEVGTHEGTITLFFDDNEKSFPITVDVFEVEEESSFAALILPIASIVIIIVLIVVVLFFAFKKKKRR